MGSGWVAEGGQPSRGAQPRLWGYSPGYGAIALLALWQPASSSKTTPKTQQELGQHSGGAAVGHPITPGRWEWGPAHPFVPPRGGMRAPMCWVWQAPGADTPLEGRAASFPHVPPLLLPQPPLPLLIHPITLRWDEGAGHSTPAWPSPRGAKRLFLPLPAPAWLCLSLAAGRDSAGATDTGGSGGEGWGCTGKPGTSQGMALCGGEARGCPGVMGLGTAMPPGRVCSINPQLLESRDGGK